MDSQDLKMTDTSSGKMSLEDKMIKTVTSEIGRKLNALSTDSSYKSCIYRVPDKPRKANEAAYTPRLVSIGPLHRERGQLQGMESYKLRCLRNFLTRSTVDLDELVKFVAQRESYIRECYEDTINLNKEQFAEVILLDGIFVIELFLKKHFSEIREEREVLFENRWMGSDLLHDMLLLENQLPMKVIAGLFKFVDPSLLNGITLHKLAREFFEDVGNTRKLQLTDDCYSARHFVDFLRYLHNPEEQSSPEATKLENTSSATEPQQAGVKFRCKSGSCLFEVVLTGKSAQATKFETTHSATELQQAGVKFCCAKKSCLFDVAFTENGVLTLPCLKVNDSTETFFSNLIALEECGYYWRNITSYVIFMDNLINTAHDVDLLVKHGIIKNGLGESKAVADLFNNLYKEVVTEIDDFYFAELCRALNEYSRNPFHEFKANWFRWKRMLRRNYFSNPWSSISVLGASVLLILTVIQTVCSILQVK